MAEERLQKILARFGIASRRKAEQLMIEGRVSVNGKTVMELGTKADAERDEIRVAGKHLRPPKAAIYIALNKPKRCVTTTDDPEGRETVMDLMKGIKERIYPVGRLDYASEGLLLLTNDGDFANAITSAKTKIPKLYEVKVTGRLSIEQEQQFRDGLPIHGRRTAPAGLRLQRISDNPWYEVELIEGRQNQIRLMFKHLGFLVEKLRRTQIGFLKLGKLRPCEYRYLTVEEVLKFRKLLGLDKSPEKAPEKKNEQRRRTVTRR